MSFEPRDYLRHIFAEAEYLIQASRGVPLDAFTRDETLRRAFVRSLEVIGEAWDPSFCLPRVNRLIPLQAACGTAGGRLLPSKLRSCFQTAQRMRAILFASATAAALKCCSRAFSTAHCWSRLSDLPDLCRCPAVINAQRPP